MARDGLLPGFAAKLHPKSRVPHVTTWITGVAVALGVLVLRLREPNRSRPFKVRFVWLVTLGGAAACIFVMQGLPTSAWKAFGYWMLLGLIFYFLYGYRNSVLRNPNRRINA